MSVVTMWTDPRESGCMSAATTDEYRDFGVGLSPEGMKNPGKGTSLGTVFMNISARSVKGTTHSASGDAASLNHLTWASSCFFKPDGALARDRRTSSLHDWSSSGATSLSAGMKPKRTARAEERKPCCFWL